jgi:hypothetical protein
LLRAGKLLLLFLSDAGFDFLLLKLPAVSALRDDFVRNLCVAKVAANREGSFVLCFPSSVTTGTEPETLHNQG